MKLSSKSVQQQQQQQRSEYSVQVAQAVLHLHQSVSLLREHISFLP